MQNNKNIEEMKMEDVSIETSTYSMNEIFIEGYKQGCRDGLEGIHMTPKVALTQFIKSLNCKVLKHILFLPTSSSRDEIH